MQIIVVCYVVILLYASYKDYKTYTVSRFTNMGILALALTDLSGFPLHLVGAVILTIPFLYLSVKTNQMGGGDIKFIFVNGCFLGLDANYSGIFIGFFLVMLAGIVKKHCRSYKGKKKIALVPYLVAGYLLVIIRKIFL